MGLEVGGRGNGGEGGEEGEGNRSPKGNMWSAIPVALLCVIVKWSKRKQGSGPKGVNNLCFHTGEFFPSPSSPPSPPSPLPPTSRPITQPQGLYPSLKA